MSAADWGVVPRFRGTDRHWRDVSPDIERAILDAMGADPGTAPPPSSVRLVRAGDRAPLPGELVLEDGSSLGRVERLPQDLPFGYHRLLGDDEELLLIAAPPRCPLPVERSWGWAVQLYATRSSGSWGIGDLADLRKLGRWARGIGAGFCVVNPLHAVAPIRHQEASPYFPSSRRFRNPLYLRPELVPGAGDEVRSLATRARQLNDERLIDRDRIAELKSAAFAAAWTDAPRAGSFSAFRAAQGAALDEWATFCAVAERFGGDWHDWPAELRTPRGASAFAQAHPDRVAFHAWLQWLVDEQLGAAAAEIDLVGDMAIGFDPAGADAWSWQRQLAQGVTIGAPPDTFNTRGQDWSLPPFVPHRLRQARYRPLIETIRANLRHARGLRIDHIMGLFRLWWVPAGGDPAEGAYVRYPADELLAIVALEAHRANAIVIGEDLGTVEPGVREALAEHGILTYRLLIFEPDASRYPELALAAVTTHDLPTIAGLWTGADLEQQRRASLVPDVAALARLREPIAAAVRPDAGVGDAVVAAHARLAASPALLVAATLEDALAVAERPNLPGTTVDQAPNWSVALPKPLEQIEADPSVRRLASVLAR